MSTSLHFFFPPVYKKSPSEGTRIRGSTLFCLRSPARPHEVLSYSVRCKGRRPGDLLSFRPVKLRNALQHLIRVRFHSPDSLGRHQNAYSFLHRFVVRTLSRFKNLVKGLFLIFQTYDGGSILWALKVRRCSIIPADHELHGACQRQRKP